MSILWRSLAEDLDETFAEARGRRAAIDARTGKVWSYETLSYLIARARARLHAAGARRGDRVLSLLPNGVEQLASFLATVTAGMDFCPLSPLSTTDEARRLIQLCRPSVAITSEATTSGSARALTSVWPRNVLRIDANGIFEEAFGMRDASAPTGKLLLFTSGTTAQPKALVLDPDKLWASAHAWVGVHTRLGHDSRFYNILPMSYLGGLFNLGLIPFACGGSTVVSDAFSGASVLRFWREVREHAVTTLWLSPTMIRSLLSVMRAAESVPRRQLELAFVGMATSRLEEKQQFEEAFEVPLLENYALSETTFLTSETLAYRSDRQPGSVGSVLPWVELRVDITADDVGEIAVKTPFLFDGYLQPSGAIERPISADGWFRTGDLGAMSGQQVVIRGRSRGIIKKGGYLVVLRELEEVAESHPLVVEAVALPMEHGFYGETAVLCVRIQPEHSDAWREALAEIREALIARLARFKWPTEIVAVSAFPLTESGKTRRYVLGDWLQLPENVIGAVPVH